jgi:RNase H-fold protein (predicted Holliday junction resolvase)
MRPKELLGLKLKEISSNPKWNKTQQKTLVILKVRKENSKTGKGRIAVAPVKEKIETIILGEPKRLNNEPSHITANVHLFKEVLE